MADLINRVYVIVDGEEIEANSIDQKISGNKAVVKVMNRRNRAKGHHHGVPDITLSLTFPNDLEISNRFATMLADNTTFSTMVEGEAESGDTYTRTYLDCEIYDFSAGGREGSAEEISVEIGALDFIDVS